MKTFHFLLLACFSFLIFSCGDDDEGNEPFVAVATYDTAYSVGSIVTLDASQSLGIDGASVQWIYNGAPMDEGEINSDTAFSSADVITSFIAKKNGFYGFLLRITKNGRFSETTFGFTVSGILELTDLSQLDNRTFENLDSGLPNDVGDYLINSVLVIPAGESYQIEDGTTLKFGENGGLDIQGSLNGFTAYFNALNNPWKGVRVSGRLGVQNLIVDNAGASSYTANPDDAANLFLDVDGRLEGQLISLDNGVNFGLVSSQDKTNEFHNSQSLRFQFGSNVNTARIGASNLIGFIPALNDKEGARFEIFYDQTLNYNASSISFLINYDIIILDSLVFEEGSPAFNNANVRFKAGAYISVSNQELQNNVNISGCEFLPDDANPAAKWRGIAAPSMTMENSTISGAGNGIFSGATAPSAIYLNSNNGIARITNSTFSDNNGHAILSEGELSEISSNTFSNNNISHIKIPYGSADAFNTQVNTFDNSITAVELFGNPNVVPGLRAQEDWASLGGSNYYLIDANMNMVGWSVAAGTHIKMKLDRFIRVQGDFEAIGSTTEPVLIESDLGNRGDWQGIQIIDDATLDFVQIKNAGRNTGAQTFSSQFGAGLYVKSPANRNVSVTNCEITNAGEYGVVIQLNAGDFAIDSTASANTLEGALGGYFDAN